MEDFVNDPCISSEEMALKYGAYEDSVNDNINQSGALHATSQLLDPSIFNIDTNGLQVFTEEMLPCQVLPVSNDSFVSEPVLQNCNGEPSSCNAETVAINNSMYFPVHTQELQNIQHVLGMSFKDHY